MYVYQYEARKLKYWTLSYNKRNQH